MAVQLAQIHTGMDAYSSDGGYLGKVVEVTPPIDENEAVSPPLDDETMRAMMEPSGLGRGNEFDVTPFGTTTPKGRGRDTAAEIVQQRGDPHGLPDADARARTSAAGVDVLRGYGPDMQRAPATDAIAAARTSEPPATINAAPRNGSILIEYQGVLGLGITKLRVPVEAVREVLPDGQQVVLAYPREECRRRFSGFGDTHGSTEADALP